MDKVPILEIQDGPQKGQRHLIIDGAIVGELSGDIQIKDSKINDLRCIIQHQGGGKYALFSQRNDSPLKINDRIVKKVSLLPGVLFSFGATPIKVIYVDQVEAEKIAQKELWLNELTKIIRDLSFDKFKGNIKPDVINQPITIEFTMGPLLNEIHEIGYLPRVFGTAQIGFDLLDLSLPREVFQLSAEKNHIFVSHLSSIPVFVNDKKIETKTQLKIDDRVTCGNTEIRIRSL